MQYHKIQGLFKRYRDGENKGKFIIGEYSIPEFQYLENNEWEWTEKFHGACCRVEIYTNISPIFPFIAFKGKTDKADMSAELLEKLNELFPKNKVFSVFEIGEDKPDVTLYGEAISHKINKGGCYFKEGKGYDFILFDIRIGNWWLKREDVENIAKQLNIKCVPVVGEGTINEALGFIRRGFYSTYGNFIAEGIVIRPKFELKSRNGSRIITKIKHKDFITNE